MRLKKDRLETVLYNLIDEHLQGRRKRLLESISCLRPSEKILAAAWTTVQVTEKPEILFQRLDLEEVMKKVEAASSAGTERSQRQEGRRKM